MNSRPSALLGVFAIASWATAASANPPTPPNPSNAVYELTLTPGVSEATARTADRAIVVHAYARDGRFVHAWARSAENNAAVWHADAADLRVNGPRLTGPLRVLHRQVEYRYALDGRAEGPTFEGAFKGDFGATRLGEASGVVTGVVRSLATPRGRATLDFAMGKPIHGGNEWQRMTRMSLDLEDGRFTGGRLYPFRANAWSGRVERVELALRNHAFEGTVATVVTNCGGAGPYSFALRGRVAGGGVIGSYRRTWKDETYDADFMGTVTVTNGAPPTAQDAAWTFCLDRAVQTNETLRVCLDRRNDRFTNGFAVVPNCPWKPHAVDASGLTLTTDGRLAGDIVVGVQPDGWGQSIWDWGFGTRPVAYRFALNLTATGGVIVGRHTGRWETRPIEGIARGRLRTWEDVEAANGLAAGHDYPAWRGPDGNGSARPSGRPLVDSLEDAQPLWRSSEWLPDAWLWSRPINPGIPGGYSSPAVAGGRVFLFYSVPAGRVFADGQPDPCDKTRRPMPGWIDTDDTMLCLEAATGRTLWKTAFKERGLNFNGGAGPHMTPCFAEGRVFGVGSAGAIHALDAGTGAVLWESTVGPEAERAEQLRRDCHAKRLMPVVNLDFCGTPLCVDGVLACNDNAGGMVGLDAATGRRRWGPVTNCLRKTGSPVVWRHDGTNYLIAVWDRAVCVAPRTGQVVWEIAEGASSESTPAVSGDILVTGGGGKGQTGLTGFRMSPAGATRLWHADGKWNGHVTSPLIHNGHAYCFGGGGDAVCIEIATGQVAGTASFYSVRTCSSFVGMDGRVIRPHLYNKLLFYDANARNFRQLGDLWVAPSYAECTTPAVSDGRMFFRGKDCVYAYDLRRR